MSLATTAAQHTPSRSFPQAPRIVRWIALLGILIVLQQLGALSAVQLEQPIPADFEYFYKAAHALVHQGVSDPGFDVTPTGARVSRGMLDWYWPIVPRLMSPLSLLPLKTAGQLWALLNLVMLFAILRMLGREISGFPPSDWPVTQLVPLLLLLIFWCWEFRLNQIDTLTLFLLVISFVSFQRLQPVRAGFWLGLAVLIKITPGLVLGWFLLKRQFRTVAAALFTILLAGPLADTVVFGPGGARELYENWIRKAVTRGSHRGLIVHQLEMDWRNQALGAVASRWLHRTNWETHFDNEPRIANTWPARYMNLVDLPREIVAMIVVGLLAISLVGLAVLMRHPAHESTPWQLRLEWALCVLAMLWFMPVMRRYHMIWTLPALTVIGPAVHWLGLQRWWSRFVLLIIACLPLVQISLLWHEFEARGVLLLTVGLVSIPLIQLVGMVRSQSLTLPDPMGPLLPASLSDSRPIKAAAHA